MQQPSPPSSPPQSQIEPPEPGLFQGFRASFERSMLAREQRSTLLRFVREWVAPRWRQIVLSAAIALGLAMATSGYPLLIKYAFNTIGQGQMDPLRWVILGIVLATAIRAFFLFAHHVVSNRTVMGLTADLQKATFAHIVSADYARLTREGTGHMVSRITNDLGAIQAAASLALNTLLRDIVMVIGLLSTMIYLDPVLSLIVLCVYPFTVLPIVAISRRLRRVAKATQSEIGDMTATLTEKLSGVRLIKTFRLEKYATDALGDKFNEIFRLRMKSVRARARLGPMLEAFAGLAIAGVIGLASWRISTGISTTGDFMAFITALMLAANAMRSVGNFTTGLQEGIAATERLYELMDDRPVVVDRPTAKPLVITTGTITLDHVTFAYENRASDPAVKDLSLTIHGGKTIALVGRSGSGKSTIINLVPRLFDVTSGAILIDGQDVRGVTLSTLRDAVSIVSQEVTLFDDTIRANIALGRLDAREDEIISAAKSAAAHDFIMAQPLGYDTRIGDGGVRLSGGQRQRLALARAILKNAPVLLLDEATSALDTESERLVQDALARFTRD
ncbi:MAG: ABC transporter ATP-binding protein, partial [Hyphomicrobiaceae bacterium]|nr:ABC transporter ATP-binding protein [Hyphomicrobiaceae bacterium]